MIVTVGANGYGTYLIFGSFGVIMFFFVWFLIPETKGAFHTFPSKQIWSRTTN